MSPKKRKKKEASENWNCKTGNKISSRNVWKPIAASLDKALVINKSPLMTEMIHSCLWKDLYTVFEIGFPLNNGVATGSRFISWTINCSKRPRRLFKEKFVDHYPVPDVTINQTIRQVQTECTIMLGKGREKPSIVIGEERWLWSPCFVVARDKLTQGVTQYTRTQWLTFITVRTSSFSSVTIDGLPLPFLSIIIRSV